MSFDATRTRSVIGAGLMGHGIAQVLAMRPGEVWLYDISSSALDRALDRIRDSLSMLARYRLLTEKARGAALARIRPTTDLAAAVRSSWFAIEAAPEDLALKRHLVAEINSLAPTDAILATNTSSFSLARLFGETSYGERVVGSHFFLPAQIVPLVEVSRGPATSEETMARTVALWEGCGKTTIRVEKDTPGYVANRLQAALVREALSLLGRGVATAQDIDTAARMSFGIRMLASGLLEQRDIGGLDLHAAIARELWPDLDNSADPHPAIRAMVDRGQWGLKTGKGIYDWSGQNPETVRRERNEALVAAIAALGLWQRSVPAAPE